jgi:hypothetical protein
MALETVTMKLPRALYRRLERLAATTHQSLDAVLLQTIRGNLPPALDDAPPHLREELALLLNLNDDDLWAVTRSTLALQSTRRHKRLLEKNSSGTLTEREQEELGACAARRIAGCCTSRLPWHFSSGGAIPAAIASAGTGREQA